MQSAPPSLAGPRTARPAAGSDQASDGSGDDAGAAVFTSEVDEGDHGRQLQLWRWLGHVTPDRLVTVKQLLLRPRAALEEVAEIEL